MPLLDPAGLTAPFYRRPKAVGIIFYPSQVLIDRRGNVGGKFFPNAEGIALLEKTLAGK